MANLFSGTLHASIYAKFRPNPPQDIIKSILSYLSHKVDRNEWRLAVDVGCGNGQCSKPLAKHFDRVYGFDTSSAQIGEAIRTNHSSNISFNVSPAETLPLESNCVQLLTACQAFHWFDFNRFYNEVNRVLVTNGVIALLGYTMPDISHNSFKNNNRIKNLVKNFYKSPSLLWSKKERQLVDEEYSSVKLPFADEIRSNKFETQITATAQELKGYLYSWSGYNTLYQTNQQNANQFIKSFDDEIKDIFGDKSFNEIDFTIHFNYFLVMARKSDN
ncbi:uncharacterized protein LOC128966413 [Oppia nitens]|uniref:uncharacterized protein LOC128966413 n=1 Tax=Oppia nitens TaxID=1686743 RepID=UPI0023DB0B21|nr:uncharacterized protein LOC128966413 [Oppia nitens]